MLKGKLMTKAPGYRLEHPARFVSNLGTDAIPCQHGNL
jgi:hypothetical protein